MFNIAFLGSPPEIILILVIVLLLFGGKKLPELMRSLGKSVSEFKKGQQEDEAPTKPVIPAQMDDAAKKQDTPPEKK